MKDLIKKIYWEGDKFSDLFVQLFVSQDNHLNVALFNHLMDTEISFKTLVEAIKEISGSKLVPYRDLVVGDNDEYSQAFESFTESYRFGEYLSSIQWILHVYEETGVVLARKDVLGWIAQQHPKKLEGSFMPVGMSHVD